MRKIEAHAEPAAMLTLRRQGATFGELTSESSIRRTLWEQQGRRCAYCERSLADPATPGHNTRIEHFHPQNGSDWTADCERGSHASADDQAPVAWGNLLLCCDGNERAGRDFTCDKAKGNLDVCGRFRNPRDWTVGRLVNVAPDGRVAPLSGLPDGADGVLGRVLNLNADHLVVARKVVLAALKREISARAARRHGLSPQQRSAMADNLRRDAGIREFGACYLAVAARLA
ncbi:hypothetical protein [Curtobacterium pusillum]|uniref:hypothetical protein n=1 Tax=Curtobacterium pusillum TaxID=69373 RepID=UPI00119EED49|nr:hypothetical protein [Curtobacterium pusillum]